VAAASERAAADEAAARLRRHGLDVVTLAASVKGKTWYRTRVGSFPNQQAAAQAAGILGAAFGYDAIPVSD
jgi:cell division protein FtsN